MNALFHTAPVGYVAWLGAVGAGLVGFAVIELDTVIGRSVRRRRTAP